MTAELHSTLYWAPEVEVETLGLLWWHPHLIALAQSKLDPSIHFTLPHHRTVLEALSIVFRDENCCPWGSVVAVVIELGGFEECGGKEGLNAIFTSDGRYPWGVSAEGAEPILRDHVRYLKKAAEIRGEDPSRALLHHTGGRGFLQKNKLATKPEHPVAVGEAHVLGHKFNLAGWPDGDGVKFKLELVPKRSSK
jgi:hypothetical protein